MQHHGSLFTLFLHSPLTALCFVCHVGDVPIHHWERCQGYVDRFVTEASRLVTRCRIDEIEQGIGYIGKSENSSFPVIPLLDFFPLSRFILCPVLRRRLPANADLAICFLWRGPAAASGLQGSSSTTKVRTTSASSRTPGAPITIPHSPTVSQCFRCQRAFLGRIRGWMITSWLGCSQHKSTLFPQRQNTPRQTTTTRSHLILIRKFFGTLF